MSLLSWMDPILDLLHFKTLKVPGIEPTISLLVERYANEEVNKRSSHCLETLLFLQELLL